jgi:hypothetical protein
MAGVDAVNLDAFHRRIKQEQQSSRDNSTPSPGFLNNSKMSSFAR